MANLLDIRAQFVKLSGREDLASQTAIPYDTDAGADWFINAGSRWLDGQQEQQKSIRLHEESLVAGEYQANILNLRAAIRVWAMDSASQSTELRKKDLDWMVENYADLGATGRGSPAYWAPFVSSHSPQQIGLGQAVEYESVIFMPPTDQATTLRIYGLFYSAWLAVNTDENYWSVRQPHLLTLASLMILEGAYRNSAGYKDWRNQIEEHLIGIDKDMVEHVEPHFIRMEG